MESGKIALLFSLSRCHFLQFILSLEGEDPNEEGRHSKDGDSDERPVEQPRKADDDERPYDADNGADETDAPADDVGHERHDLQQSFQDGEDAVQADDDQEDTEESENPHKHVVRLVLSGVNLGSVARPHHKGGERLSVLCLIARERVVFLLGNDGDLCWQDFRPGDAHVAHSRTARADAIIQLIVVDVDQLLRLSLTADLAAEHLSAFLVPAVELRGVKAEGHRLVASDAAHLLLVQDEGTESHLLSLPFLRLGSGEDEVFLRAHDVFPHGSFSSVVCSDSYYPSRYGLLPSGLAHSVV